MALKITTQIGTNQGITDEAYIRIEQYSVDKSNGNLNIQTSMYLNKDAAASGSKSEYGGWNPIMNGAQAQNIHYPSNYSFPLTHSVITQVPVYTPSQSMNTVLFTETSTDGTVTTGSRQEWKQYVVTGSQDVIKSYIDLSAVVTGSVFEVAYPLLKEKLEAIAGVGNVVYC
jgi:hypothetical protein